MGSFIADKMVMVLTIYIICYTIIIGIVSGLLAEEYNQTLLYNINSPDSHTSIGKQGGFQYGNNVSINSTDTIDISKPELSLSWGKAFIGLLATGNVSIFTDGEFIMTNMFLVSIMFWLPFILLIMSSILAIF